MTDDNNDDDDYYKMLLIRSAANAGGVFKFVVSLNIFTTVQCTEPGVEGFNRVQPISSTHFLIHSYNKTN